MSDSDLWLANQWMLLTQSWGPGGGGVCRADELEVPAGSRHQRIRKTEIPIETPRK